MLELAKKHIESHRGYTVLKGVIYPTADSFLLKKMGDPGE